VPAVIAFLDLAAPLDLLLQTPVLRALRGEMPITDVTVVGVRKKGTMFDRRVEYPAAITRLVDVGARAIFFDVAFSNPSEHDDAIAAAVEGAAAAGVPVVMAIRFDADTYHLPGSPALQRAAGLGLIELQADLFSGRVRRAPIRRRTLDGTDWWHAAALTVGGSLDAVDPPRVEDRQLIIGPLRNPVWAEVVTIPPAGAVQVVDFDAPDTWDSLADHIAVLGVYGGTEDRHQTPDGPRYGAEVQAVLIQTLLRQQGLRLASPDLNALVALGVGIGTVVLGLALPARRRWMAGVLPLAALGLLAALAEAGIVLAPTPIVLALVAAIWVLR